MDFSMDRHRPIRMRMDGDIAQAVLDGNSFASLYRKLLIQIAAILYPAKSRATKRDDN
jgi:hypothetical protein